MWETPPIEVARIRQWSEDEAKQREVQLESQLVIGDTCSKEEQDKFWKFLVAKHSSFAMSDELSFLHTRTKPDAYGLIDGSMHPAAVNFSSSSSSSFLRLYWGKVFAGLASPVSIECSTWDPACVRGLPKDQPGHNPRLVFHAQSR